MDLRPARTRGYQTLSTEKKFPVIYFYYRKLFPVFIFYLLFNFKIVYQNRASIYLLNESSLIDLNRRLEGENHVTYHSFRPNIIIKDCPEYEEDNWQFVLINDINFRFMSHCGRCVKITINLETAQMGTEPLKTLRKYRTAPEELKSRFGYTPLFGIYLGPENEGIIRVNDLVFSQRK